MRLLILPFLLLFFLVSCKKDDADTDNPIIPDDTLSFAIPKLEEMVMYEVNIRAFGPGSDFQAVISRLDEIKALGINVIWLMPIHPVGQVNSVNSPYCVQDYKAVNPEFGTLADFKDLIEEAHKLNIAVIIDWVANHTAWDNPWISNTDWYTQDGSGNIIHPPGTNWQDVADLNFDNPDMRLSMIEAMQYWINGAGIDGFRCDAADFVPYDFWQQAIQALDTVTEKDLILLAEGARQDHFNAGFQMNYAWDFYNQLKNVFRQGAAANTLYTIHLQEYAKVPDGTRKLRFTTNHDESAWDATPVELFYGKDGAMAASVATICLGGVPLIYGSQEVGMAKNIPFFSESTIDWSQNPEMLAAYQQILSFYHSSLALQKEDDGMQMASLASKDVLAFMRTYGQEQVLVMVNTRNKTVAYDVPSSLENTSWKNAFDNISMSMPNSLELQPYEYRIFKN